MWMMQCEGNSLVRCTLGVALVQFRTIKSHERYFPSRISSNVIETGQYNNLCIKTDDNILIIAKIAFFQNSTLIVQITP